MADVTYTPIGHAGFTCEVTSEGGSAIRIVRHDLDSDPVVDGDSALSQNRSLVRRLVAYADSELACRRARQTGRKAALRKAADLHLKVVVDLADLIDLVGDEATTAWCSGCLEKHSHRWVQRRSLTPDAYLCDGCGAATTPCLWPGCKHFALRKPGAIQLGKYCAEHQHLIPGFEKLNARLSSLDEYDSWLDFESRHAKKITALTGGVVGGALVVAPLFFAAAPAIGGAIGAWGGLSGAAASSHGLALLGGGAVASGGLGMVGGAAVVTAAGASLGGALGASVTTAYAGDDPSFRIELVEAGHGPPVIFSNGFLSEDKSGWGEWEPIIRTRYPDSPVYRLHWGAKEKRDLRELFGREIGGKFALRALVKAASTATQLALKRVGLIGGALSIAELAKNPWWVARTRANMTGAVLADLIARTDTTNYVLVGHSLGARVMMAAAEALGSRDSRPQLESVHFLGAAVSADHNLSNVGNAVTDKVWNYSSRNDAILGKLYRGAQFGQRAAGAVGFTTSHPNVKNRNVSQKVAGHSKVVPNVTLL
jgi:pimeloyl-ACP methyl ester carboxylesterase